MNAPDPDSVPAVLPDDTTAGWGPPRSKTVVYYDAHEVRRKLIDLSGREYLQGIVDGKFPPPPVAELIGSRLVSVGDGEAVFRCVPDGSFLNPLGLVHGGLLCTLLDSAMGVAVQTLLPAATGAPSIQIQVSFLKPLPFDGSEVEARGRALRVGRRVAFAEGHAYDSRGTLLGHATTSLAVVGP